MSEREQIKELPPKYYLDNFRSLLFFVERMYGALLRQEELNFISAFRALSEDAQCLFLRFANRKGLFFRTDKLVYSEINQLQEALDELLFRKFISLPASAHGPLAASFLQIYSKPELLQLCRETGLKQKGLAKLKKPDLIVLLLQNVSWQDLLKATAMLGPAIKHNFEMELELLKFLYFGYLGGDMAEFVIRDLGMLRIESPEEEQLVPRFTSRQEIDDLFAVSLAYNHFRELRELNCPESLYSWYCDWEGEKRDWSAVALPLWTRLTLKVARMLERHRQYHWALEVYKKTDVVPSRERRVRLLQKTGAVQEARELCFRMQESHQNADELFFARDFLGKIERKKARKSTTLYLKEAEEITISGNYKYQVEQGVIAFYAARDKDALHSENYLWRSLFGLVFWDVIFDHDAPVYHSPLQRSPSGLYLSGFFDKRKTRMLDRMNSLSSSEALTSYVTQVYEEKKGIGNSLVGWHANTLPLLQAACRHVKPIQLQQVLMEMADNLKENGRGFPDLFVWTENDYQFIEVKSPNDTLSAQQLFWLQFFRKCDIKAKVLKVEWGVD